jgi:hypothetical protein
MCIPSAKVLRKLVASALSSLAITSQWVTAKSTLGQETKKTVALSLITRFSGRKNFSHGRNKFPLQRSSRRLPVKQGVRESQPHQLVGVGMADPYRLGSQVAAGLGQRCNRSQGNAGNFQQNLRGERQRPPHCDQGSSRGDVQRRRKLQQFLPALIAAADKNWNRQWQAGPLPAFVLRSISIQLWVLKPRNAPVSPHLGGQMNQ